MNLSFDFLEREFIIVFIQNEKLIRVAVTTGSDSYEDSNQKMSEWEEHIEKRNAFIPKRAKDRRVGLNSEIQANIEILKIQKAREPFPSSKIENIL